MIFERIEAKGLAHYSYLLGDGNKAVVIDPRRDCEVYVTRATSEGMRITDVLETHRNEDYVTGSVRLARLTDATIWHADTMLDYRYGSPVAEGQTWGLGRLTLEAISTPGHTPGSFCYLLREAGGHPWMVFSGDTLFAGDVGRVDLLGMDRAWEMASCLYDSIFTRLLPLGDGVIVCPAHGPGSVCGTAISDRPWTTLGMERMHNPMLQARDRRSFQAAVARELERPPYFRRMEVVNLEGAEDPGELPAPQPLAPDEFATRAEASIVLDTRSDLGYVSAHVPGSQFIWMEGLASFAGWFLPYEVPILLVCEKDDPDPAVRVLARLGYDNVAGYLAGGMLAWHMAGRDSTSIEALTVRDLCRRLDRGDEAWILDVRSEEELARAGRISGAKHIHVTMLPERMDEVLKDRSVYVFCGSGMRSVVAASLLERHGCRDLCVILGGLSAWSSARCPVV